MDDDFNTGGAIGDLFELVRTLNKFVDEQKLEADKPDTKQLAVAAARSDARWASWPRTLGLFREKPKTARKPTTTAWPAS